jgi:hypothetical protein
MINFFRKIRRQSLVGNKISKYLLYALGEILLVVIGILIALQVNTYNNNKIVKSQEEALLIALQSEFLNNFSELEALIDVNASNIASAKEMAQSIDPNGNMLTSKEMANHWNGTFRRDINYRPSVGVIKECINSGRLYILSSIELREKLVAWEVSLEETKLQEKAVSKWRWDCFGHLREMGSFRNVIDETISPDSWYDLPKSKFVSTNNKLFESLEFENDLILFLVTSKFLDSQYLIPLKEETSGILELLNSELNLK